MEKDPVTVKTTFKRLLLLAVVFVIFGLSPVNGQKVQVDVDKGVNFAAFRTFGWDNGTVARNPIIAQQIMSAIENELTQRGLRRSDDDPDLKIAVMAAVGLDVQGVGPSWNSTVYRSWGGYGNPAAIMNIPSGNLLIDLVNKDKVSIFRGVAKSSLPHSPTMDYAADAKSVEKHVKKAVKKIFDKYPVRANP